MRQSAHISPAIIPFWKATIGLGVSGCTSLMQLSTRRFRVHQGTRCRAPTIGAANDGGIPEIQSRGHITAKSVANKRSESWTVDTIKHR